jgi:hypothetical protein
MVVGLVGIDPVGSAPPPPGRGEHCGHVVQQRFEQQGVVDVGGGEGSRGSTIAHRPSGTSLAARLVAAIRRFCDGWNQRRQPVTRTKDADQILTKLKCQATRPGTVRA